VHLQAFELMGFIMEKEECTHLLHVDPRAEIKPLHLMCLLSRAFFLRQRTVMRLKITNMHGGV